MVNILVQPRKDGAVCHHLLNCNYLPTFVDFTVLCHEIKKYLLELKESLFIMRDRPSMCFFLTSKVIQVKEFNLQKECRRQIRLIYVTDASDMLKRFDIP